MADGDTWGCQEKLLGEGHLALGHTQPEGHTVELSVLLPLLDPLVSSSVQSS